MLVICWSIPKEASSLEQILIKFENYPIYTLLCASVYERCRGRESGSFCCCAHINVCQFIELKLKSIEDSFESSLLWPRWAFLSFYFVRTFLLFDDCCSLKLLVGTKWTRYSLDFLYCDLLSIFSREWQKYLEDSHKLFKCSIKSIAIDFAIR